MDLTAAAMAAKAASAAVAPLTAAAVTAAEAVKQLKEEKALQTFYLSLFYFVAPSAIIFVKLFCLKFTVLAK